ncbi:MarR family transcriptional regulator [Nocardioides sp.]|uniref:MarR family winged helix-turn-helix transcriptional regulator n=1 Tax=Nocardioides sp. TaxID=35761 RepID=UPI002D1FC0C9|nr:MarR family transcriptional regulator [Nocardioides sp.]
MTRWLDPEEQRSWRALILGMTLLLDRLDADLRSTHGLSLTEYEILVRLSEEPDHRMRMAQLADSVAHSRSRLTHTVARLEKAGVVVRCESPDDRRGVLASLTEQGYALLEVAAHTHVEGVRQHLVDLATREDFATLGRVMNAVTDDLIGAHPAMELRH